jgi:hypothetical protein
VTHRHQKCVRTEISGSSFLDVNRYSVVHPIGLRQVFLRCVNISTRIFDDNVSFPGLYGGLYGQNFSHEFKIKIPLHNCHIETDYLVNDSYYGSVVVRVMIPRFGS